MIRPGEFRESGPMFTKKGTEYTKGEAFHATGGIKPWGRKLRRLRKELGAERRQAQDSMQEQATSYNNKQRSRQQSMMDFAEKKRFAAAVEIAKKKRLKDMGLMN